MIAFLGLPERGNFGLFVVLDSAARPKVERILERDACIGQAILLNLVAVFTLVNIV